MLWLLTLAGMTLNLAKLTLAAPIFFVLGVSKTSSLERELVLFLDQFAVFCRAWIWQPQKASV